MFCWSAGAGQTQLLQNLLRVLRKRQVKLGAERPSSTSQLVGTNLLVLTIPNKDTLVHAGDTSPTVFKSNRPYEY